MAATRILACSRVKVRWLQCLITFVKSLYLSLTSLKDKNVLLDWGHFWRIIKLGFHNFIKEGLKWQRISLVLDIEVMDDVISLLPFWCLLTVHCHVTVVPKHVNPKRIDLAPASRVISPRQKIIFLKIISMVIELSGMRFVLKSCVWFQYQTSV